MNYLIKQRIHGRLQGEEGAKAKVGKPFRIGLVYPNHYYFGMSNLGFQTLYKIFNQDPQVSCGRIFLPEEDVLPYFGKGSLSTYEGEVSACLTDLIAFSISYQNDYLNLQPVIAGIAIHEARRTKATAPLATPLDFQ